MRPLFLHNEADPRCLTEQFEYLLGPDVLVAPVWQAGQSEREVYLPEGSWVHLWTGKTYGKGEHTVPAPLGDTPVFYRADSCRAELMEGLRARFGA
jgi:alpha-glucosidase